MKERTTPDCRNTPSTANLEEEEIVDAPGNGGNASMPEQVKRPNPWRKMIKMIREFIRRENHLERTDNTRLPKHALNYKPRGRRDRGRPRKRWQCVDAGTGQPT